MANLDLTAIGPVLEELYPSADMTENIMRANPALALINNKATGGGLYRRVQLKYTRPQGRAATFADAQANAVGSKRVGFNVDWANNYQVAGIDGDVIDDAQGNRVMLIEHVKAEMDGAVDNMKDDLGFNLFRNTGGSRGSCANDPTDAGGPITLADLETIAHFEVGMTLKAGDDDGTSGSTTVRAGEGVITDVDRDAGTITYSGTITGITTGDHLFADGDLGAKMAGFLSWIPTTAPTSTAFFGVDRTSDVVRLAGVRYVGTSDTTAQALVNLTTRIRRNKYNTGPDVIFVSPLVYGALDIALESRKRIIEVEGKGAAAGIGFDAIELNTPAGAMAVVSDPSCQEDLMWAINTNSWCFETVGEMVRVLDEDGNPILRQAAADGYELRVKCRGNFWCNEPGSNGQSTL